MSVKPVFVEFEPYRLSFHQLAQEPGRFRTPRFDRFIRMFRFRRINPQQPDPLSIAEQNRVAVDRSGHGRQVMIGIRRAASCSCWAKRISLRRASDVSRHATDASLATATASSTSSTPAKGTRAVRSPVDGSWTSP